MAMCWLLGFALIISGSATVIYLAFAALPDEDRIFPFDY